MQINTAMKVFSSKGSVVEVAGISKELIFQSFFVVFGQLLKLPTFTALVLLILSVIYFVYQIKQKKIKLEEKEIKLSFLLLSVVLGTLLLYLTSKNPVWSYHFIGVEIIFLFLIGLIIGKIKILRITLLVWIFMTLILNSSGIISSFHQNPYVNSSSLATGVRISQTIIADSENNNFNIFAYSPSIYSYEYSYLFKWLANRSFPYDPGLNNLNTDLVYLIIPKASQDVKQNFINYRTPSEKFSTIKQWNLQDGTVIIKRKRKA